MSTDEIDMIYEDARKYYKYYLMDWVNKNFNYASIKMMYLNQVNKNDDRLDPYNMYIDLVKKHAQSKKKAYQKEQKKEFFDELQSAVYEDLVKELKILDALEYHKTTSTDYNYVFERDWMEYSNGYLEKMKAAFKRKYGFELDLMYAINVCVKKSQKDVLHFENKAELEDAFNNTFTVNVLDDLMKVFLFENIEEKKDLFVNLIAEKDKFHNKVLVEVDGKYILYKELAWQALQRYRCDVYVNPHRYFEDAFVTKITKNFEKALAEKLKAEFPGSYAITGIALNKFGFGGKRELDIIFVYGYSIHIIECKKIRMSESITEAIGSAGRARGEWNEQREEERKEYNICRIKLLTAYSEELGIELDNLSMYKEKFDLVTSETTLAHRDNDRRIFIIKDLINNIRAEAMHKDAPET